MSRVVPHRIETRLVIGTEQGQSAVAGSRQVAHARQASRALAQTENLDGGSAKDHRNQKFQEAFAMRASSSVHISKKVLERMLRRPERHVSVANKRRSKRRAVVTQSLAMRRTKDSVTLARVREIVEQFSERDRSGEIITAVHHIPARNAQFAPMPEWVRAELAKTYADKGVTQDRVGWPSTCTVQAPHWARPQPK